MNSAAPVSPSPTRRRHWVRWAVVGVLVSLLLTGGAEVVRVYAGLNDHEVIPGRVYRSAQPAEGDVAKLVDRTGIRTVLNLRGTAPWDDWYKGECRATFGANVSQEDVTLSAHTLPFPAELRRVVEVLDRSEYPVLVHCKQGADRTGLVSAMALLIYTDATVGEARRQLLPRYGHWPVARTVNIDRFFDLYESKLTAEGGVHSSERFRRWVLDEYCPGPARSRLAWLTPPPAVVAANTPLTLTVLCENRSDTAWHLSPGVFAGVHVCFTVYDASSTDVGGGRAGLRQEAVPPGGYTEVSLPVRGLPPGRYRVVAELHDATGASIPFRVQSFTKFGDDSLVAEFVVKERQAR